MYSLRVSGEFPTQGTQIPLIFVYFTFGIILDFLALIFFVFKDYLVRRDNLPNWLQKPGVYLLAKSKKMGKKVDKTDAESPEMQSMSKCNNCDLCQNCVVDKNKDKEDDDKKNLKNKILRIFNRLVFFVFLFMYFLCYTIVWGLIAS